MREAKPLTISTPPHRSMQAMAAWSALSKSAGICPASGGLQEQVVELNQLLYADRHEKHHAIITENPGNAQ
ncbi:regulatory protein [Salmonella enterica subsp. enterica]|uniref:Regulatory protein n=1 Tax=Salmonella enterica I TaxID=59201 RepID=A0A379WPW5_SALET|nr:regulatory protein [Salmonella enterica subsp. enterica]